MIDFASIAAVDMSDAADREQSQRIGSTARKRMAVAALLEQNQAISDQEIARQANVSPTFVGLMRARLGMDNAFRVGRDGRVQDTSNIGGIKKNAHVLLLQKVKRLHDEMEALHYFSIDEAKLFNAMSTFLRNSQPMED